MKKGIFYHAALNSARENTLKSLENNPSYSDDEKQLEAIKIGEVIVDFCTDKMQNGDMDAALVGPVFWLKLYKIKQKLHPSDIKLILNASFIMIKHAKQK